MLMVGYADDHPADCYRMYNPVTDRVIVSRDVKWATWARADPTATLKQLQELEPEIEIQADLTHTSHITDPHVIPDDDHDAGRDNDDTRNLM
jgi:hypothetical protein